MGIYKTYSKRLKEAQSMGEVDVYVYDEIPESLRIQIIHIWDDAIGHTYLREDPIWDNIQKTMCRELGVFELSSHCSSSAEECREYIQRCNVESAIDIIEFSFSIIDKIIRQYSRFEMQERRITQEPDSAIAELNHRFKEYRVGYEFINGEIIRIDRQYIHEVAIKPAIRLLYEEDFEGASNEFLKAHEHYRKGNYKEAIAEALKSFESTIKTICDKKKYKYNKNKDTSSTLISIVISKGLIPTYLENHFTGLRKTLEAGLPTLRNKTSGHGQGQNTIDIPEYIAAYAINLAATNIVLLVNSFKSSRQEYIERV